MRIIKRYLNRKLYDTELSKYVSLDHVLKLAVLGKDFAVLNNKTGEDLTASTLFTAMANVMQNSTDTESVLNIIKSNLHLFSPQSPLSGSEVLEVNRPLGAELEK